MNDRLNRATHADLLAQVERDEARQAEIRRALYAPLLTEADLDAQERYKRAPVTRACSRCESGMSHCVTPAACERAEDQRPPPRAGDLVKVWGLFLAAWAAVALVVLIVMWA